MSFRNETDTVTTESWRNELRVIFPSAPLAVREALGTTLEGLQHLRLSSDECSTVELVLAEVMNNIVEHAYPEGVSGMIELRITNDREGLHCMTIDDGIPIPGGVLPYPDPPMPVADPPEGGFGWFLIRELSSDLVYSRDGGHNRLEFRLDVGRKVPSC